MTTTKLELEATNLGKPTNKKVITNRKWLKETIPQAWLFNDNWYYNQAGAFLEWGDRLPTKDQWTEIYNEIWVDWINKLLSKAGYRNYSDGSLNNQGSFGYYWSSSPATTYGYYLYFNSTAVYPAGTNYRALGFSVRCLKN